MGIRLAGLMLAAAAALVRAGSHVPPAGPIPAAEAATVRCTISAAAIAEAAQQVCGGAPIEEALRSVHLRLEAAEDTGRMLAGLRFKTALDLQLLAGMPEAAELLGELKAGGLPIGDRARVRLLVGDNMHHDRHASGAGPALATSKNDQHQQQEGGDIKSSVRRQLQDEAGLSMDTIAIVLTVLVSAAGYFVQALTSRRGERAAADEAQKLHISEQTRQREHEQMVAQIARTDRWLE